MPVTCLFSDIFTVTDEAFCILLLKNNKLDYHKAAEDKKKITQKESQQKYIKSEITISNFKEWDRIVFKRFNTLVQEVQRTECKRPIYANMW